MTISSVYPTLCRADPSRTHGVLRGPHRWSYTPGSPHTNTFVSADGGYACRLILSSSIHPSSASPTTRESNSTGLGGSTGRSVFAPKIALLYLLPTPNTIRKRSGNLLVQFSKRSRHRMSATVRTPYNKRTCVLSPFPSRNNSCSAWIIGDTPTPTAIIVMVRVPIKGYCIFKFC
jgi:hypothetical protein